MKKLDEIMELMSDEMADFKENLGQLQLLNNELEKKSIPISTETLEKHLNSFLTKQEEIQKYQVDLLKGIDQKLKKSIHIPNYILILFGSALLFLVCFNGYLVISNRNMKMENQINTQEIRSSQNLILCDIFCS